MKDKIKIIVILILGIIVSVIINVYSITLIKTDDVSYKESNSLKSTSDPDYINGVYNSSNTLNKNITDLKKKGCFTYTGTTNANGYLTVTHNKGLGTNYYPVVSINAADALVPYRVGPVTSNSFVVSLVCVNSLTMSTPANKSVTVYWCY